MKIPGVSTPPKGAVNRPLIFALEHVRQAVSMLVDASDGHYLGPGSGLAELDNLLRSTQGLDSEAIRDAARKSRGKSALDWLFSIFTSTGKGILGGLFGGLLSEWITGLLGHAKDFLSGSDETEEDTSKATKGIEEIEIMIDDSSINLAKQLVEIIGDIAELLKSIDKEKFPEEFSQLVTAGAKLIQELMSILAGLGKDRDEALGSCFSLLCENTEKRCECPEPSVPAACEEFSRKPSSSPASSGGSSGGGSIPSIPSSVGTATNPTPSASASAGISAAQPAAPQVVQPMPAGSITTPVASQGTTHGARSRNSTHSGLRSSRLEKSRPEYDRTTKTRPDTRAESKAECTRKSECQTKNSQDKSRCGIKNKTSSKNTSGSHKDTQCALNACGVLGALGVGIAALGIAWLVEQAQQWWIQIQAELAAHIDAAISTGVEVNADISGQADTKVEITSPTEHTTSPVEVAVEEPPAEKIKPGYLAQTEVQLQPAPNEKASAHSAQSPMSVHKAGGW
ncbi:Zinc metalloprotease [Corynebacterium kutscheri]|uniref:hypothetical protein n=1 Tax=Corynebacterium kutscheri TaxID=35755 RepID=UPI000F6B9616|nr:hypothetical protein [Corynebacterium kutscheri]VEH80506.1 Zinc metalloprotease [Corynebacterium kutscheri]